MKEQAEILRWEDPKPSQRHRESHPRVSRFNAIADELRANPLRWAVIAEFPGRSRTALSTHVRIGAISCFTPAGDFDAVARQVNDHTAIYARYVGDPEVGEA